MELLYYNIKLLFSRWDVLIFPLALILLIELVLQGSSVKLFSTSLVYESISPLILGILTVHALSLERKFKLSEIIATKYISPEYIFILRYGIISCYGVLILFFIATALTYGTDFFKMGTFVATLPTVLFLCSFGFFLSSFLDRHLSTICMTTILFMGNTFISSLAQNLNEKVLLFFPNIVTFFPKYEYFWWNRLLFSFSSIIFLILGTKLMRNTEKRIG